MENPKPAQKRWYCIRCKPKRQHVAASYLRALGIEVFNPQLRLRRATRKGPLLSTSPVFPNYLFARFDLLAFFRAVRYAFGVSDIVRFGDRWVEIDGSEIAALQDVWGDAEALQLPQPVEVGSPVVLAGGLFHGIEATVVALLPGRQRVRILLEFLGGLKEAEVDAAAVLSQVSHPLAIV